MRLRFKADADLRAQHEHQRGAPVVVLSELRLVGPSSVDGSYSWRQEVLSLGNGCTPGWARPDQLELPHEDQDREPDYLRQRHTTPRPQSRNSR
jgi:hypothetical protein